MVNLRSNTATGGVSVDVPTWAAGCVLRVQMVVATKGTSTSFLYTVSSTIVGALMVREQLAVSPSAFGDLQQVIVPFFDEPIFTVAYTTDGTGTASTIVVLVGFVRNV